MGGQADDNIDRDGDEGGGDHGLGHVGDVVEDVVVGGEGRQHRGVGQGGQLIPKLGAGVAGARHQTQVHIVHRHGQTHHGQTRGGGGAVGGPGHSGEDAAQQEGAQGDPPGADDLQAVVDEHGQGPGKHQAAQHKADGQQDGDDRHGLADPAAHRGLHLLPGVAAALGNDCGIGRHHYSGFGGGASSILRCRSPSEG